MAVSVMNPYPVACYNDLFANISRLITDFTEATRPLFFAFPLAHSAILPRL